MKPPRSPNLLLVFLAPLLAWGCAGPRDYIEVREDESRNLVASPEVMDKLKLDAVRTRRTPTEFLEFQATLVNRTTEEVRFQWLVEWFDQQGFKIDDPTQTWQPAFLTTYAEMNLKRVAPTLTAVKAHVRVTPMNEIK
jgi:uncharacterized protein YcfL